LLKQEVAMNIVYNSEHFSVLAYPEQGFELLDKTGRRSLFLHGVLATCFSAALERIPDEERTEEAIDSLLDHYCAGSARPIMIH